MKDITYEEIYDLYVIQQKSQRQIANLLGIGQTTVRRLLSKYNIPSRTIKESKNTPDYMQHMEELKIVYKEKYTIYKTKECEWCKKEFDITCDSKNKRFCSKECLHEYKMSLRPKQYCKRCGKEIILNSNQFYQRVYCDECVIDGRAESNTEKIDTTCGCCGKELKVIPSKYKKNKYCYCDVDCMAKHYSQIYCGENSPTWNGGKSHHYTGGFYFARKLARERDNYTCQLCGITEEEYGQQMSVHHIKNYRLFEDKKEANELCNLICLCEKCHRFIHSNNNIDKLYISE